MVWNGYPHQREDARKLTAQGLGQIRRSVQLFLIATLEFLVFASAVFVLHSAGQREVGTLGLFWLFLMGAGVMVPLNIIGAVLFLVGYEKMKKGKSEFGSAHSANFTLARKHLILAAVVALIGWIAIPQIMSFIGFMHPPVDLLRTLVVGSWALSLVLTTIFVLECGRGGAALIRAFLPSSMERNLKPAMTLAVVGQILGHIILLAYFIPRPQEITWDIPPLNSALFFPASAVLVTAVTLVALLFYERSFRVATHTVSEMLSQEDSLQVKMPAPTLE